MKSLIITAVIAIICMMTAGGFAHEHQSEEKYTLKPKNFTADSEMLDTHYRNIVVRMEKTISRYDLLNNKNIRSVPHQVEYSLGKDYIKMEKRSFIRSAYDKMRILSVQKKSVKIYTDGSKIKKIETRIYHKNYRTENEKTVLLVDASPSSGGTGDITVSHAVNGKWILKKKKFGTFRNTTASPVQNDMKRNFLIDCIDQFNSYLIIIGEGYEKETKNNQRNIAGFLKESAKY